MVNRRKFIQLSALTAPLLSLKNFATNSNAYTKPIVVSTWPSGKDVNTAAWKVLSSGGRSLDAIEAGGRQIEDTINCCVGLGGNPDRDGIVTLDSCIMDEHANCGAVAAIARIKHPISVARMVMEKTPHVLLVGQGATDFAVQNGFPLESGELSPDAEKAYKEWLKKSDYKPQINIENTQYDHRNKSGNGPYAPSVLDGGSENHDTMALVAIDASGNMSGGVTTSGMAFKMHGRVGDSAIIGAGMFVDNNVGGAVSTGVGEETIRICGSHTVVELMRQGNSPEMACRKAVERVVKRDPAKARDMQVAFLALDKNGKYGAFAIQKGFSFWVKSNHEEIQIPAKYLFEVNG